MNSRFCIGIDLGTTNCVLSFIDTFQESAEPTVFSTPQYMGEERIASFDLLPSFLLWNQKQAQPEASWIVGTHAYEAGAELPELVIQSAKSWLCHKQIESDSRVLPWQSAVVPDEAKCSPIYALSLLLMHLRRCWDEHWLGQAGTLFCDQEIIITVPASFDEAAQTSVVNAAKLAGYPEHIRLLEEPHAALVAVLYDSNQHASIQERFSGGFNALVIDIGGGTTDFSLFNIQQNSSTLQSKIGFPYSLQRTAASDHILLGGDNIDLFIAHLYLAAAPLDFHPTAADWQQLRKAGALLKEQLFSSAAREINPSENSYVSISNRYGSLFANTITLSVNKAATRSAILDGFFPRTNKSDNFEPTEEIITNSGSLTEGLKVQGLPFSQESAFTRHLQFFLNYCAQAEEAHIVDVVLLTGGTLLAPEFQRRMVAELPNQVKGSQQLLVLANDQAYFSAAKGAAVFAYVRRVNSELLQSSYAGSLYLEVSSTAKSTCLLCIVPKGLREGERITIDNEKLEVAVNKEVRFRCYRSNTVTCRKTGALVDVDPQLLIALPPLCTRLELTNGNTPYTHLAVRLEATLSATGVLELSVRPKGTEYEPWQLQFESRKASEQQEPTESVPPALKQKVAEELAKFYGKGSLASPVSAKLLFSQVETIFESSKDQWTILQSRSIWDSLWNGAKRRSRSAQHEASWYQLAGWILRPGFGSSLDKERIQQLWTLFPSGTIDKRDSKVTLQWWILWRRIAAGLPEAAQATLMLKCMEFPKKKGGERLELIKLGGCLHKLANSKKMAFARLLIESIKKQQNTAECTWALGRLGARRLIDGNDLLTIPPGDIWNWFGELSSHNWNGGQILGLSGAFAQMAEYTDTKAIDLTQEQRRAIQAKLRSSKAPQRLVDTLSEGNNFTDTLGSYYTEDLPPGFRLKGT